MREKLDKPIEEQGSAGHVTTTETKRSNLGHIITIVVLGAIAVALVALCIATL